MKGTSHRAQVLEVIISHRGNERVKDQEAGMSLASLKEMSGSILLCDNWG